MTPERLASRREYQKEWARKERKLHPERVKARLKKCRDTHSYAGRYEEQRLKRTYGITISQRDALLSQQGNVCAICKSADSGADAWNVDHCHSTKEVRGLLCRSCNVGLGHFRDDETILSAAIDYLRNSKRV